MIPRRRYDFSLEGSIVGEWRADKSPLYTTTGRTTLATNSADPVGSWSDLRGSNHAGQASASLRPTYNPNGLATGKPAVIFDGVDDVLSTVAAEMPAGTVFVVGKALELFSSATSYPGFVKLAATPADFSSNGVLMVYDSGPLRAYMGAPNTGVWQDNYIQSAILANDIVLLSWRWGSVRATNATRRNMVANTLFSAAGTYSAPSGSLGLHFAGSYIANVAKVAISHVLAFSAALDNAAMYRVDMDLNRTWRLGL